MSDNFNDYQNGTDNIEEPVTPQNSGMTENVYEYSQYQSSSHSETGNDSPAASYAYVSENSAKNKKPRKNRGLKAVAFVLSLAIVGFGSVQGYKIYNESKSNSKLSELEPSEETVSDDTKQPISAVDTNSTDKDMPSLIQLASRDDAKSIPDIVEDIMPSVVGISATFSVTANYGYWGTGGTQQFVATGTGIVMTSDGYIVTNAHVIYDDETYNAGEAIEVSVLFSDESKQDAKIIAYDTETDIAVLKVDANGLKPATFGDSSDLRVGELVIAVGNPLGFDLFGSVTSGIVSALNRQITINDKNMNLIQTDAAINSGNSGGPLLNSCGQVIGINSAKMSSSYGSATVEGLGFAIPISDAKVIIDDLINYNHVKGRPQIGITASDVTEAYASYFNIPMGVYVRTVEEGSAADLAGLQIGDVIIDIEGEAITTSDELNKVKNKYKAGDTITLTISRNGQDIQVELTLQEENAGMEDQPAVKN